ncbi:spindle and kinetochore-associated protein 2-like [Ruditapes philippinarum]|uniref:spindle and kinetochore-associated protein 2-like n=1 Tax=Ruditapes philippinarum TaxID=129788 RepID=UPI00295B633E|nr:spindle and kinetochore-associated protein 2-like [Ruditapes philippinarum]
MQKAAERVEAMFQKADSDVNSLSQRLKFEFENNEDLQQTNPAELLSKISDVKKEYSSLVQQVEAIQESQKEALGEFRGHLNDVCQLLLTLQTGTGMMPTEKPEELTKLEEFLGSELPWGQDVSMATTESGDVSGMTVTSADSQESPEKSEPDSECQASTPEISPSQLRSTTNDFVEVTQQEFESVSSLIRGRVKLTEVNSTYSTLWKFFKSNKDCTKLAPDELHKMGLKVSGVTGQAKLKVLRALKLIKLSTKGEVLPADK